MGDRPGELLHQVEAPHDEIVWCGLCRAGARRPAVEVDDVLDDLHEVTGFGHIHEGDLKRIGAPPDHLGINYYAPMLVAGSSTPTQTAYVGSPSVRIADGGRPKTAMGWEIDERGLLELLLRLRADYPAIPLYITENGAAFDDVVHHDGVHDADRIAYLEGHLRSCAQAIGLGVPLKGYFVWSLLDNFEWAEGYHQRFGLVRVDYDTQLRTPKDSFAWLRSFLAGRS